MCSLHCCKRKKFIPEQFATYHFRRKYVSGSYVSLDPKEYNDNDEVSLNDESDEESNIVLTADDKFSVEGKDAAHFEQMPRERNSIKCLTESELKRLMDQILSGYSTCGENVKKKINGIMLSLHEICSTDGFNNGIFNTNNSSELIIENAIDEVIKEHNTSFLQSTNNFIEENNHELDYI